MSRINRAYFTISNSPGTAGALTVSSAVSGPYRTLGSAQNGLVYDVAIVEGSSWEVRTGCTYTHSGTSLSRGTLEDSSTGSAINFTSAALVLATESAAFFTSVDRWLANQGTNTLRTGRFYVTPGARLGGTASSRVLFTPFHVPNAITLTSLSVKLSATVNTGTLYLGIVTDDGGQPGTLLTQANQAIGSGNANSTVTLTVSQALTPGLYWVVQSFGATANADVYQAVSGSGNFGFNPLSSFSGQTTATLAIGSNNALGYSSTHAVNTTLPSTFPGLAVNESNFSPAIVALGF